MYVCMCETCDLWERQDRQVEPKREVMAINQERKSCSTRINWLFKIRGFCYCPLTSLSLSLSQPYLWSLKVSTSLALFESCWAVAIEKIACLECGRKDLSRKWQPISITICFYLDLLSPPPTVSFFNLFASISVDQNTPTLFLSVCKFFIWSFISLFQRQNPSGGPLFSCSRT